MPFYGQDWRSNGETWVRTHEGWERKKLRPLSLQERSSQVFQLDESLRNDSETSLNEEREKPDVGLVCSFDADDSSDPDAETSDSSVDSLAQPHCFVKTNKSKEFVGCTSMSDAFYKLNFARVFLDVQRFNYVCKVVQILIRDKLQNLSGSARKILLWIVEVMVLRCLENYTQVRTVREMVKDFMHNLNEGHHCGSPQLIQSHQCAIANLYQLLCSSPPKTPAESNEDSVTFLDLPQECFRAILRRLPDHQALMDAADAHTTLSTLVHREQSLWQSLCRFHFTAEQIVAIDARLLSIGQEGSWRHAYFELKNPMTRTAVYADEHTTSASATHRTLRARSNAPSYYYSQRRVRQGGRGRGCRGYRRSRPPPAQDRRQDDNQYEFDDFLVQDEFSDDSESDFFPTLARSQSVSRRIYISSSDSEVNRSHSDDSLTEQSDIHIQNLPEITIPMSPLSFPSTSDSDSDFDLSTKEKSAEPEILERVELDLSMNVESNPTDFDNVSLMDHESFMEPNGSEFSLNVNRDEHESSVNSEENISNLNGPISTNQEPALSLGSGSIEERNADWTGTFSVIRDGRVFVWYNELMWHRHSFIPWTRELVVQI